MSIFHRFAILVVFMWVGLALPSAAQVGGPIDHRVDGRVLDANNRVGSGGYNAPVNSFNPNASNLMITGNVTGGRAFRGFSPIRDPNSFYISLPTSSLSGFQRDSIGLADVTAGRSQAVASPFYLPSSTVTSVGGLGATTFQTTPGTMGRAFAVPRMDLFTGKPLTLDAGLNPSRFTPSAASLDPRFLPRKTINTSLLGDGAEVFSSRRLAQSPLFGLPRGVGTENAELSMAALLEYQASLPGVLPADTRRGQKRDRPGMLEHLFDSETTNLAWELAPTLFGDGGQRDLLAGRSVWDQEQDEAQGSGVGRRSASRGMVVPLTTPSVAGESEEGIAGIADSSRQAAEETAEFAPARRSVFEDFRGAVAWSESHPEYFAPATEESADAGAKTITAERFDASVSYVRQILSQAPQSFAGVVDSDLNVRIRKAESLMHDGEFYNAAAQYSIATMLAPDDPLPRLGQGHAYLAAGDYLSAVYHLTRGLERFPEVAHFRLDLYEFVSDPSILDIRRADLETRLEKREDYRLRFLLGYVEYYGGLKEFGLRQLKHAAQAAPADSIIARFPDILSGATGNSSEFQVPSRCGAG
ncbi:MAG: hypothetical protein KAV82_16420 [Phycisphaerae bacterium]|nr:hypothetical protein [Phycisphaerae bacterium]